MEFLYLLIIMIAFYFILVRPVMNDQKKKKKTVSSLKKNNKVVISGGIIAVIDDIFITENGISLLKLKLNKEIFIYSYPEVVERLITDDSVLSSLQDIMIN